MTIRVALVLGALAAALAPAAALADPPVFTPPLKLPHSKPEGTLAGGEPSVAYDPTDDGGSTWGPCGNMLEPGSDAQLNYSPSGGTGLGKPAIGPDGTVYVPFILPSSRNELNPYDRFYMAVARGGCNATTQWQDVTIHSDPGADLSHFCPNAAVAAA